MFSGVHAFIPCSRTFQTVLVDTFQNVPSMTRVITRVLLEPSRSFESFHEEASGPFQNSLDMCPSKVIHLFCTSTELQHSHAG